MDKDLKMSIILTVVSITVWLGIGLGLIYWADAIAHWFGY